MPCKFNKGVQVVMYVNSQYERLPMLKAIGARYLSRHNTLWATEEYHQYHIEMAFGPAWRDRVNSVPRVDDGNIDFAFTARDIMRNFICHGIMLIPDKYRRELYFSFVGKRWSECRPIQYVDFVDVVDGLDFWELYNGCLFVNRQISNWTNYKWDCLFDPSIAPSVFDVKTFRDSTAKALVSYELGYHICDGHDLKCIPIIRFWERFKREFPGVINRIPDVCKKGLSDPDEPYCFERVKE